MECTQAARLSANESREASDMPTFSGETRPYVKLASFRLRKEEDLKKIEHVDHINSFVGALILLTSVNLSENHI
jgi:hypothetical protein